MEGNKEHNINANIVKVILEMKILKKKEKKRISYRKGQETTFIL